MSWGVPWWYPLMATTPVFAKACMVSEYPMKQEESLARCSSSGDGCWATCLHTDLDCDAYQIATGVDDTIGLDASRTHQPCTLYMSNMDVRSNRWWSTTSSTMTSWHQFHSTVAQRISNIWPSQGW
jgi:hypothetical protein